MKKNVSLTKEKIKTTTLFLCNESDSLSVSTNHIAKKLGISPGNLYYHYKNKEAIIRDIYHDMSVTFESFNSFEQILSAQNPLKELDSMFDRYGELFWEYRFLMRDSALLMAIDPELKTMFAKNQAIRVEQIELLLKFLIDEEILEPIPKEQIHKRAKLNWFISAYWQVFTSTYDVISKESIRETKEILFELQIYPFLSQKGKNLLSE
ncbi:TetR/AcrR family transcriptional regulator [Sulfurospirillum oryzae]|uniref:TetR/AcrR family transcriptional regulator n=1 Tax=Sulfurospirillum oryzae TaxID=2976535 RepID=UPI0021E94283|nr:TetR/AcrR family transcriptional regulator [Sulfurospirillum oryzae]